MSILTRTDDVPAGERFAFWREEVMPQTWVPMECHAGDEASFSAQLRTSGLGAIQVNLITSTPLTVRRTARLIRRSAPDLLKLMVALRGAGHAVVIQDERQAHLGPGDFALYDTTRPYEVRSVGGHGPFQALTLHFPRSLLPLPDSQVKRLTAVPMRAGQGVGALTSCFLQQLAAGIEHYSPAEAARLSTAALEVLATRLAHELGGDRAVSPETHRRAVLERIHAYIQQHLGDAALSPRMVADANNVSLRYLHKLFQGQGETVARWIRARRLEGCRRDLADPALAARPVVAVAARWGFGSAAHFSQTFKSTYGMPPQKYRRWAQPTAATPAPAPGS